MAGLAPPSLSAGLQQQLKLLSMLHPEVPEEPPAAAPGVQAPEATAPLQLSTPAAAPDLNKVPLQQPQKQEPIDLQAFVQKALNGTSTPLLRSSMQSADASLPAAAVTAPPLQLGMTMTSPGLPDPSAAPSAAVALQAAPSKTAGLRPAGLSGLPMAGLPNPGLGSPPGLGGGLQGVPPLGSTAPANLQGLSPLAANAVHGSTAKSGFPGVAPLQGNTGTGSDVQSLAAKALLLQQLRNNSAASNASPGVAPLLAKAQQLLNGPKDPSAAGPPGGLWAAKAAAYAHIRQQADQKLAAVQATADAAAAAVVPEAKAPPPAPSPAPPPGPPMPPGQGPPLPPGAVQPLGMHSPPGQPPPPGLPAVTPPPGAPATISPELVAKAAALALAKGGQATQPPGVPGGPQIVAPPPGAPATISPDLVKAAAALAIAKGLPGQPPGAPASVPPLPGALPTVVPPPPDAPAAAPGMMTDERLKQLALMTEPGGGAGGSGFSGAVESAVERMNRKRAERFNKSASRKRSRSRSRRRRESRSRGKRHDSGHDRRHGHRSPRRDRSRERRERRDRSRERRDRSRGRGR